MGKVSMTYTETPEDNDIFMTETAQITVAEEGLTKPAGMPLCL